MLFDSQIRSFANRHLAPYTIREDELIPELCPICHGGENQDKHTFAINLTEGVYVCKRGSCGARGRFEELAQRFGERADILRPSSRPKKQFVLPDVDIRPLTDEIISYFDRRKISKDTLNAFGVGSDDTGNIIFPFYRDGGLVYVKYRAPRKPQGKEKKEWQEPGTRPILFGIDMCSFSQPLIITEGQVDCLSLYEAGARNVVSVPSGCSNLDWIDHCWDWLERFKTIILFGDNDDPGKMMVQEVVKRLDEARCMVVEDYPERPDGGECKDANEILFFYGKERLMQSLDSAQPVPVKGILQLADVMPYDPTTVPRIKTTIPALDETIGGLAEGGVTVFTGVPGAGKSTLTGQILLSAIEQGLSVCAYSGELTKEKFQEWINFQAAGSEYIGLKYDPVRSKHIPCLSWQIQERLMEYYRDHFYLFDNNEIFEANQSESILKVFQLAARRYGCKLFLADNLMTALSDSDEETKAQGRFANALKKFATRYHVHVILVAHPRKIKAGETLKQDDIGGSSATIRLADSAIVVEKPNLRIIKNREGGLCRLIECCYCPDSRRIYQADKGDLTRVSWNKDGVPLPEKRADSLPDYAVRLSESALPF